MAVKIRLARIGKKGAPFYRLVAIDSRNKRDGQYLENLGTYDSLNGKVIQYHEDRVQYWVSNGAIITDAVKKIQKVAKKAAKKLIVEKVSEVVL